MTVTLSDTDGYVVVDAVQLVPLPKPRRFAEGSAGHLFARRPFE